MIRMTGAALAAAMALSACATTGERMATSPVALPNPCADVAVSIYFERDSTELTNEAAMVLRDAANRARECRFGAVDVVGLADAVGTPGVNMAISEARARVVTTALADAGFTSVTYRVLAAGEAGAITPSGEARPLRRRVDIIFHPRAAGA